MRFLLLFVILLVLSGCPLYYQGVYIYSVTATPTSQEQITLKNDADTDADISQWTLGDLNDPWAYTVPSGTILGPYGKHKFSGTTLGFQINDEDETIYLRDDDGEVVDTWSN
jgi:hypothetical protein